MSSDGRSDIIASPEDLGKYLKIANPFIWFLTIFIILVLLGFIIWGITGSIDYSIPSGAIVNGEKALCYVSENDIKDIKEGTVVKIDEATGKVFSISESPVDVFENKDLYALHISGIDMNDPIYAVEVDIDIPDGIYKARIVTKSEKPISFVIN